MDRFGLAPCGVCRAALVALRAVRSYRTFSPLPLRAVYFLWYFPSDTMCQSIFSDGTLPYGVRKFLPLRRNWPGAVTWAAKFIIQNCERLSFFVILVVQFDSVFGTVCGIQCIATAVQIEAKNSRYRRKINRLITCLFCAQCLPYNTVNYGCL